MKAAGTEGDATDNARLSYWLCNSPAFGRPSALSERSRRSDSPISLVIRPTVADEATVRRAFLLLHQSRQTSRQLCPKRRAGGSCASRRFKIIVITLLH
ncbi:unnamed protein product [Pieris macdunnoughi]|uniref:Uncharacterized protein n=1 Tax=Pieris macdunnoughi TaxID=345717 RepID=A0A821V5P1_9NEOP|nr:unnamed protein product [Pieris macdunnoughi]